MCWERAHVVQAVVVLVEVPVVRGYSALCPLIYGRAPPLLDYAEEEHHLQTRDVATALLVVAVAHEV